MVVVIVAILFSVQRHKITVKGEEIVKIESYLRYVLSASTSNLPLAVD